MKATPPTREDLISHIEHLRSVHFALLAASLVVAGLLAVSEPRREVQAARTSLHAIQATTHDLFLNDDTLLTAAFGEIDLFGDPPILRLQPHNHPGTCLDGVVARKFLQFVRTTQQQSYLISRSLAQAPVTMHDWFEFWRELENPPIWLLPSTVNYSSPSSASKALSEARLTFVGPTDAATFDCNLVITYNHALVYTSTRQAKEDFETGRLTPDQNTGRRTLPAGPLTLRWAGKQSLRPWEIEIQALPDPITLRLVPDATLVNNRLFADVAQRLTNHGYYVRTSGGPEEAFPDLFKVTKGVQSLRLQEIDNLLDAIEAQLGSTGSTFSIAGIELPMALLTSWSALALLCIQFYLAMHLARLNTFVSTGATIPAISWIGLYPSWLAISTSILSFAVIPVACGAYILLVRLNSIPGPLPIALVFLPQVLSMLVAGWSILSLLAIRRRLS